MPIGAVHTLMLTSVAESGFNTIVLFAPTARNFVAAGEPMFSIL